MSVNFGWMRKDNFSVTLQFIGLRYPSGIIENNYTVIQMDSVVWVRIQRCSDFRYNKYDGYTGTASKIRFWLSNTSNYDTFSGY